MKKPNLDLSYHVQDGVLLPDIRISDQLGTNRPWGDTAAWR